MISVGIDISKGKSTVCILKPYGEVVAKPFEVRHTEHDLEALVTMLQKLNGEIKVVMEERRLRTEDDPQALLFEQANAVAFQAHPYRRPVIGWMNDLENMTAADAKAW